jgi:ATP phosphoribosyltransferase regulatory subunit
MTEGSKSDNSRWVHQIFSNAVDKEDYSAVSVDLLQPISWFFDLYGEDVRHRVCMLDMPLSGAVCLRPEFTIPLAYKFLSSGTSVQGTSTSQRYSYSGDAFFRSYLQNPQTGGTVERYLQSGIEIMGEGDAIAADVDVFMVVYEVLKQCGCSFASTIGDMRIIFTWIDSLEIPHFCKKRLKRHLRMPKFHETLASLLPCREQLSDKDLFFQNFASCSHKEAKQAVQTKLDEIDEVPFGTRTVDDIVKHCLERSEQVESNSDLARQVECIKEFLAIEEKADKSVQTMQKIIKKAGMEEILGDVLGNFEKRLDALKAHGIELGSLMFNASYGRGRAYYDGFIFEMHTSCRTEEPQPAAFARGGRYDRLLEAIGAPKGTRAVGGVLYPDMIVKECVR